MSRARLLKGYVLAPLKEERSKKNPAQLKCHHKMNPNDVDHIALYVKAVAIKSSICKLITKFNHAKTQIHYNRKPENKSKCFMSKWWAARG